MVLVAGVEAQSLYSPSTHQTLICQAGTAAETYLLQQHSTFTVHLLTAQGQQDLT